MDKNTQISEIASEIIGLMRKRGCTVVDAKCILHEVMAEIERIANSAPIQPDSFTDEN